MFAGGFHERASTRYSLISNSSPNGAILKEITMEPKRVVLIGLDPDVVDYDRWPGLTPEKLVKGFEADRAAFAAEGYEADVCFIDHGQTADCFLWQC